MKKQILIIALLFGMLLTPGLSSIPVHAASSDSGSPTHLAQTPPLQTSKIVPLVATGPFTTFDPKNEGFTQQVYGSYNMFFGGVAFSHHGDPIVNSCQFYSSTLVKFLNSSTYTVFGTTVHTPVPNIPSPAGCGMTNNPDGFIYSNTSTGVRKFDDNGTEYPIAGITGGVGVAGNALGIAVQPGTGAIFYVTSSSNIQKLNVTTGVSTPFLNIGGFVDQIVFDGTGKFLYLAQRSGVFSVVVIDTTIPAVVSTIPLPTEPDGMAIHIPTNTLFVVSTAGTIERVYLSNNTSSTFASGGFRGDNSEVGPDGCLYLSQAGTRFQDGTVTTDNSLVTICPNFVTPPGINHPPIAKDDYVTMPMNTSIKINVLANDADPDNNTLTIVSNTAPSNGNAVINADKTITYTPNTGFVGSDSFQYTISDGHGGTATATVHVTVTGNVNKIHTAIMLKPILPSSVPWNATIMVQGKLVSTLTNMGIGNAKITFIGNGSGQIPFTITKSDGTFKAIGKAPVTAANHWIVQAKYPGNSTYTQSVSNPVSFNTLKHKTTLLLATSFGILDAGEDISFIAMLNDLNNGGSPIEEANIHFDGNGVIGVADQVTNGTGFAIAEGTAPSTTGTWNSQAHFSGVSTDPNDMNLYLPADSNIAKYVTVMHK